MGYNFGKAWDIEDRLKQINKAECDNGQKGSRKSRWVNCQRSQISDFPSKISDLTDSSKIPEKIRQKI